MLLNCGVGEDSWESLGLQRAHTSQPWRKSVLNIHWKDWCWSWNSNTLATWCEELTHLKRPWCWERLKAGGEGGDRGWDGWMASPTQWAWVWVNSGSWWWTGKPGKLQSMGWQRVGQDWATELNWRPVMLVNYFLLLRKYKHVVLVYLLNCVQLFCDPLDYSLTLSSVHGNSQGRIPEWVATSFSRGSSQPRDWTCISCIGRQILYHWVI